MNENTHTHTNKLFSNKAKLNVREQSCFESEVDTNFDSNQSEIICQKLFVPVYKSDKEHDK